MKAIKLIVHNYRSIHDASFDLSNYALLIGANNAGKSTMVNAIRLFYEKDGFKYDPKKDYPFDLEKEATKESWVELHFKLDDDEYDNLAPTYKTPDKILRVRRFLETATFQNHEGKTGSGQVFGYKSDSTLHDEPFYGARNVQSGKFGDLIFIPAISKVDDHTKFSGQSALRDLVKDILAEVTDFDSSYKKLETNFKGFSSTMQSSSTNDGRSLKAAEESLDSMLSDWGIGFKLTWTTPSIADIIKSMISPTYVDLAHNKEISITDSGSGFQRHLIYSVIKTGADFAAKKPKAKKTSFEPDLRWIVFEEPEAFLHPPQQNELSRSLQILGELENTQVLCTTHSGSFVNKDIQHIANMARVQKDARGHSELHQISAKTWTDITDNNKLIAKLPSVSKTHPDDMDPDMEAIKYAIYLNPDRACMFFARRVLIVEGPTETALINHLIDQGKISTKLSGLHIVDSIGKFNIHRFMNLLAALGIEHAVLHDADLSTQTLQQEVNELIMASQNAFTFDIKTVKPDLEDYLGLPKPPESHRKPQSAIYNYEKGNYKTTEMQAFCQLVEGLIK
jgi:putative ATP-dependent endonuclease of the OLD family